MNMKLSEVIFRQQVLAKFVDMKLPYRLGHAISKNLLKLQDEIKLINEGKNKIVEEYVLKDENGVPKMENDRYIFGENEAKAAAEYEAYLETETEIDILMVPMSVLEIEDSRFDVLTVAQIAALDFMID